MIFLFFSSHLEERFSLPLVCCLHVQEKIVKPHLKHDYNMICKIKPPAPKEEPVSFSSMVWKFFAGLFSGYRVVSTEEIESEL
jgi:multiple inositol-polyphosphate phosphatase / 2,3-bisphosphoglycerate 3-phosphatase